MALTDVLHISNYKSKLKFTVGFENKSGGIEGTVEKIFDKQFDAGTSWKKNWNEILKGSAYNDGITYIVAAIIGSDILAYVGKTVHTLTKRYSGGVTGGLGLVFNSYEKNAQSILECTLYNASSPALVEGWCYQLLLNSGITLANKQDPN